MNSVERLDRTRHHHTYPHSRTVLLLLVVSGAVALILAGPRNGTTDTATAQYIGANKCKNCHSADESGNQYAVWKDTAHAKAYETLASDKAREDGRKRGVTNPQQSSKCLKCHVTAFGEPAARLAKGFDPKLGVQCESCHGAGGDHFKARFAAAAEEADDDEGFGFEEEGEESGHVRVHVPKGEINAKPNDKTCRTCHNEDSPEFKDFCFREYFAKIQHFDPRNVPRTQNIKRALEKKGACNLIPEMK